MPHFILDCSEDVFERHQRSSVMRVVFQLAEASGLFDVGDIKVRLRPCRDYLTAGSREPFVHVFAYIMEGRTIEQKQALSAAIVSGLKELFPDVPTVSMNVMDFERATYHNRNTV